MRLSKLEKRLQLLIEEAVGKIFPFASNTQDLVSRILKCMHENVYSDGNEVVYAPNLYIITINPNQNLTMEGQDILLDNLSQRILEAGLEAGYTFSDPPVVRIQLNSAIQHGDIQIIAQDSQKGLTATVNLPAPQEIIKGKFPSNAFLIIDGTEIVNLLTPIINIGRRNDNQIVLKDPRVSRLHAQMRVVKGKFVVFDLDSASGTLVNGQPINQKELLPGDVITIGGVPLVYGEDSLGETDSKQVSLRNL
jgi:hypothetical protein